MGGWDWPGVPCGFGGWVTGSGGLARGLGWTRQGLHRVGSSNVFVYRLNL
jgi:hypothetical protein